MNVYKRVAPAVVILLLTVLVAGVVTVNAVAQSPTSVALTATTTTPAPYQYVTFTATLTSGGTPLSGKSVAIYHYVDGVRYYDITANTDANGQVKLMKSWAGTAQFQYYAAFAGDTSYAASTSSELMINVGGQASATSVALTTSNANPASGESYTLSGTLKDSNNAGLANKAVQFYWHYDGQTDWTPGPTVQTTSTGSFSWSDYDTKNVTYKAAFAGESSYAASTSNVVTINVQ